MPKFQEAGSTLRVGFALSKWRHFDSVFLLRGRFVLLSIVPRKIFKAVIAIVSDSFFALLDLNFYEWICRHYMNLFWKFPFTNKTLLHSKTAILNFYCSLGIVLLIRSIETKPQRTIYCTVMPSQDETHS